MYDVNGDLVQVLGSRADPWKIRAVLRTGGSDPRAVLVGDTICGFQEGVCAFESLGVSHSGSGYIIDFEIFDPVAASFAAVSASITIVEADLAAGFSNVPGKDVPVMIDEVFMAHVDIRDLVSQMTVDDISWKDHTWVASLSIYSPDISPAATLNGTLMANFNVTSGIAEFTDISLSAAGRFALKATVISTPAGYNLMGRSSVIEVLPNVTMQSQDVSYNMTLRAVVDYDMYAAGNEDLVEASVFNYLQSIDNTARYHDFVVRRGSVYIDLWASGVDASVQAIVDNVRDAVAAGLLLNLPGVQLVFDEYMLVDAAVYGDLYGTTTTTTTTMMQTTTDERTDGPGPADNNGNLAGAIAGGVVAGLILISVILVVLLIIKKKQAKTYHGDEEQSASTPTTPPSRADGQDHKQIHEATSIGDGQIHLPARPRRDSIPK